jgi:zinc ribbon protein
MQCTCGATLPDDARFCHRCGKPQYEEDIARIQQQEVSAAPAPPQVPTGPPDARISFHNRRAVGVSIAVGLLAIFGFFLLSAVAPASVEVLVLPLFGFAGFTAAMLYSTRSGERMTAQSGARIGFMTALWAFLVIMILATFVVIALSDDEMRRQFIALASSRGSSGAEQAINMFQNPRQFTRQVMGGLLVMFCLLTFPSMLGGMLGVRFRGKHQL